MNQFIYLIQPEYFIGTEIYKLGRSEQEYSKRVMSYPEGSVLYLQIRCDDCVKCEEKLIIIFKVFCLF